MRDKESHFILIKRQDDQTRKKAPTGYSLLEEKQKIQQFVIRDFNTLLSDTAMS